MDLEQEVKYEMITIQLMEMAVQLQLTILKMDMYVTGDLQLHQINENNEHQDTIKMTIKISESIDVEMVLKYQRKNEMIIMLFQEMAVIQHA